MFINQTQYRDLAAQFLAYSKKHPEGDGDIYDRFKSFLLFIGLDEMDSCHEVGLFMNKVCDLMD